MAKKKKNEAQETSEQSTSSIASRSNGPNFKTKNSKTSTSSSSALNICRNKHWRYISSFHGSWLQLPPEVLETLAWNNYNLPRPRPIDPAVFFDILKIRNLVEDATNLSVKATCGIASSPSASFLNYGNGLLSNGGALGIGLGGRLVNTKLSKERKHRLREQATQKLSLAYHLDEIACSVATMQSASTLEDVAQLVLQRNSNDMDAKYVHFFHEKIPSRQMAECTTLQSLNEIIAERPSKSEILRTRAVTRIFKKDFIGAAQDLTNALRIYKYYQGAQKTGQKQFHTTSKGVAEVYDNGRWTEDVRLDEVDQPSGLETQLLFHRAGVYLTIACQNVDDSLPPNRSTSIGNGGNLESVNREITITEIEAQKKQLKARRNVKTNAKRAIRDYLAYLSHFDYTPGFSNEISAEITSDIDSMSNSPETSGSQSHNNTYCNELYTANTGIYSFGSQTLKMFSPRSPKIHSMSSLFSATPPTELPPYPETPTSSVTKEQLWLMRNDASKTTGAQSNSHESLTYHPLLSDALHSLLLCHCLVQTSARELQRHAYMVSRLARVCNGYPIFQAPRSPSRADWIEILRHCENWIQLSGSWESLCNPDLSPGRVSSNLQKTHIEKENFVNHKAKQEALEDDRVHDKVSFQANVAARQRQQDVKNIEEKENHKSWDQENGKDYPFSTERAHAIMRWINEAPQTSEVEAPRKKKRSNKIINRGRSKTSVEAQIQDLTLNGKDIGS